MLTQVSSYATLIFKPRQNKYECMACTETYGFAAQKDLSPDEVAHHAEAHQMGLDYALVLQKKGILK